MAALYIYGAVVFAIRNDVMAVGTAIERFRRRDGFVVPGGLVLFHLLECVTCSEDSSVGLFIYLLFAWIR